MDIKFFIILKKIKKFYIEWEKGFNAYLSGDWTVAKDIFT